VSLDNNAEQCSSILPTTRRRVRALAVAVFLGMPVAVLSGSPPQAEVFAPGVISGPDADFAPSFLPDSSMVLFTRRNAKGTSVMISTRHGSVWSSPTIAPFSGQWVDLEAALAPDGSYALFASNRPSAQGGNEITAFYGGQSQTGGNLWRVEFSQGQWGIPQRLSDHVNDQTSVWTPSIARDGALYFMTTDAVTGRFRLHVTSNVHGDYGPVRNLPFSTGQFNDVDPAVDPRGRFLIFSSDRGAPGDGVRAGPERLFIAFEVQKTHPLVCPLMIPGWEDSRLPQIEARLSPDGHTLYFASRRLAYGAGENPRGDWDNGQANIWEIPFRATLWNASAGTSPACRTRTFGTSA
jgi:hypothetical protein